MLEVIKGTKNERMVNSEVMGWQLASQLQYSFISQSCHLYDYALLLLYSVVKATATTCLCHGMRCFVGYAGLRVLRAINLKRATL